MPVQLINGLIAGPTQFTHHAQVRTWSNDAPDDQPAMCAGSIISALWILTAASCVVHTQRSEAWLGSVRVAHPAQRIRTSAVHVHANYADGNVLFNIALLRLRHSIEFNAHTHPVLLASADDDETTTASAGRLLLVSGFGDGKRPLAQLDRLRYARVRRTSAEQCERYFPGRPAFVCTQGYDRPEECPGNSDAGAPLVMTRSDGLYVQVGLFAVMQPSACADGQPVGYVDVSVFLPWIRSFTGEDNGLLSTSATANE